MDRLIDLHACEVNHDFFGDKVSGAIKRNGVRHHVEHSTGLKRGRGILVLEVNQNINGNAGILAEAQKVHMGDAVFHRIKLNIARDGADGVTIHFKVNQSRQETARLHMGFQGNVSERHDFRGFFIAINNTGNHPCATNGSGGPLAGLAASSSFNVNNFRHGILQIINPSLPPRVDDAEIAGL